MQLCIMPLDMSEMDRKAPAYRLWVWIHMTLLRAGKTSEKTLLTSAVNLELRLGLPKDSPVNVPAAAEPTEFAAKAVE